MRFTSHMQKFMENLLSMQNQNTLSRTGDIAEYLIGCNLCGHG